jgi:hypothetical protein
MLNRLSTFWFLICLAASWGVAAQPQAASVYLQIITVKTPEKLDHVIAQLQSGQGFAELAQKHSTHSTAENGGVWGPVRVHDLPEAVSARIEKAAEGELLRFSDPALGHVILKKISPDAARKVAFQFTFDRGAAHLQRNEKESALKELKKRSRSIRNPPPRISSSGRLTCCKVHTN